METDVPLVLQIVLGLVLAVITIVLLPIVLRIVSGLLEIGMPLLVGYVFSNYYYSSVAALPIPAGMHWWVTFCVMVGACIVAILGMYVPIAFIQHGFRHWRWTLPNNWHHDAPCRYCSEDEAVNEYLVTALRRKSAEVSPLRRTMNEIVASVRALPAFLLTIGASGGLLALGFAAEQPWEILAGALTYGAVVAWRASASESKAQSLSLSFLGLTRADALRRGREVSE
jgi:hypothetical protein